MSAIDKIVASVVSASGVPTARRRRELERELRGHLEDVVSELRLSGCPDEQIEDTVRNRFGDPREIAQRLAETYKLERALVLVAMGVSVLLACGIGVTVSVFSGQASAAIITGLPLNRAFSRLPWELCGVASLTVGYLATQVLLTRSRHWSATKSLGFALPCIGALYLAVNVLPASHKLGLVVAFSCAVSASVCRRVKSWWLRMLGTLAPLFAAWMVYGPVTGNGRFGPWHMLALVSVNLLAACQILGWLVRRFESIGPLKRGCL